MAYATSVWPDPSDLYGAAKCFVNRTVDNRPCW